MLTVTVAARVRLACKLVKKKAAAGFALRFMERTGGFKLRLDRPSPDDTAITHEGKKVLVLDEAISEAMKHMTLDIRETDSGPRLALR